MALFGKSQKSSSFGRGQQSSRFGIKPNSLPQKPFPQRQAFQKTIPPKPAFPKQTMQKPIIKKPIQPKPAVKKPVLPKPKAMFEQKPDWERGDFMRRVGKGMLDSEKKKLNEVFSPKLGTYISEIEAKQELRKLKKEGYRAEKVRKALEKRTGLQGKY